MGPSSHPFCGPISRLMRHVLKARAKRADNPRRGPAHRLCDSLSPAILLAGFALVIGCCSTAMAANSAPVAAAGSASTAPSTGVTIQLQAADVDDDPLTYIVVTLPTKGSITVGDVTLATGNLPYTIPGAGSSVTYTPTAAAHGSDSFTFKANDGTVDSAAATIALVINRAPTAGVTTLTTLPDKDLAITLPVTDADKDTLAYVITTLPGHGRLKSGSTTLTDSVIPYSTSASTVAYTPDTNYHGQDTFSFTATDGYVVTSEITVSIQINTIPVPTGASVTLLPGTSKTIELAAVDADKDPIRFIIASLPAHGVLSIDGSLLEAAQIPLLLDEGVNTVLYTVVEDYRGTDSFHFRVQDSVGGSDRAVVLIAVNTPPEATNSSAAGFSGTTITGVLSPTDDDGDALTLQLVSLPEAGTLKINGATATLTATYAAATTGSPFTFTYTPEIGDTGQEFFEWLANDGREDSNTGTVTITILAVSPSGGGPLNPGGDGPSSGSGTLCGSFGAGGIFLLCAGLLLAPSRTFRLWFSRPAADLYGINK